MKAKTSSSLSPWDIPESFQSLALKPVVVAVAGNPNVGKSTLINALAGVRLQVGNWPGVTVEKKTASCQYRGSRVVFVDLPGVYSLSPYSQEEIIARDFLISGEPDVIINVVDATNLERNIYFTLQLLEIGIPVIVALNMFDEAREKQFRIDTEAMATMLGADVIPTVATQREGLDTLLEKTLAAAAAPVGVKPAGVNYGSDIEEAVHRLSTDLLEREPGIMGKYPRRWLAIKVIEGDAGVLKAIGMAPEDPVRLSATRHLREAHGEDMESLVADLRYGLSSGLVREALSKPVRNKIELTERIDAVVLNRYFGLPFFFIAMWFIFKLTFDISAPFTDWIDGAVSGPLTRQAAFLLTGAGAPAWTVSLAAEGVIGGVGFVLAFTPAIFAMMFFITFLEGSGYMARAAFIMDRAMHAIGLHGRSFIPMLMGFGCNVPAIYATRTLENERDKALTALLIPLMSCGARLPVYVLFTAAFFTASAGTVLWSLYVLGIFLAVLVGMIFKKTLFRGASPLFIMELPPYRLPTLRSLTIHTWEKGKHFLIKAGTYIFAVTIIFWFLLNMPWGVVEKRDSYLGQAGQAMTTVFAPLGFGTWEAAASLISGVIAKEIVVGSMAQIYGVKDEKNKEEGNPSLVSDLKETGGYFFVACRQAVGNVFATIGVASLAAEEKEESAGLKPVLAKTFTPLSAYAFMAFVLLYMPCFVVLIAMRQEFGTWKWAGIAVLYQTGLAWGTAFVIYQGGRLIGLT
ncbi:MAG TPA: ferrous iron transport protein B [Syntrophus sp. (in: bacteria)]|jgi:ferrous iron transport protein B|nr:ferrous iron transport protein B [Syntrophus sp. (in: bacteria)]